jgi:mono/diheme cytochrome c family protein
MDQLIEPAKIYSNQVQMRTVGNNPAELLPFVFASHKDKDTLAFSLPPLFDDSAHDPDTGQAIQHMVFTSRPQAWWRVHKQNALFYNGMARGQHRGSMSIATGVCVDSVTEAQRVDDMFKDIQAYVETVRAPKWKRTINQTLVAQGKPIFAKTCSGCHGTYADDRSNDAQDTYPNLLIPLNVIGTDPFIARINEYSPNVFNWYNQMFYGKVTPFVFDNPCGKGYIAPPLDGIWAMAPYFHNGSVPNIELVLNSTKRPKYWKRVDYDSTHIDEQALGWPFVQVTYPQWLALPTEQKYIYDTTYLSQGNGGHTFGDNLTDAERRAVIEYLKTL